MFKTKEAVRKGTYLIDRTMWRGLIFVLTHFFFDDDVVETSSSYAFLFALIVFRPVTLENGKGCKEGEGAADIFLQ